MGEFDIIKLNIHKISFSSYSFLEFKILFNTEIAVSLFESNPKISFAMFSASSSSIKCSGSP